MRLKKGFRHVIAKVKRFSTMAAINHITDSVGCLIGAGWCACPGFARCKSGGLQKWDPWPSARR